MNSNNKIAYGVLRGVVGFLIGQWEAVGGILNARCGREEGSGKPEASSTLNVG